MEHLFFAECLSNYFINKQVKEIFDIHTRNINMNIFKFLTTAALILLLLAACGGGGSGTSTSTDTSNTTTDTVISGMASKGPVTGTISVYVLNSDGSKGSLLKSKDFDNGSYSINIGKYAGPIIAEVIGSYTDEATGLTKTITADAPMRAALSNASGTINVAVTPLTELAVQKAGALTPSAINAGNKLISDIFKVDIINTQPVAPTATAVSSATQSQKDYTLAIAVLSQLALTRGESISTTLSSIAGDISFSGMNSQTATSFQNAVAAFMSNTYNNTGVTDPSATNISKINGKIPVTFTLAIEGNFAANSIKGIQFEVVLPSGLTVRTDAGAGEVLPVLPEIVTLSASAAAVNPNLVLSYSASSRELTFVLSIGTTSAGIGAGDLATITCDILTNYSAPAANALSVNHIMAVDGKAVTISGVNVRVK